MTQQFTEAEQKFIHSLEYFIFFTRGIIVDVMELCQDWLLTDDPTLHILAYLLAGNRDKAIALCDKAITEAELHSREEVGLRACRGLLYSFKGQDDKALADFDYALAYTPNDEAWEAIQAYRQEIIANLN